MSSATRHRILDNLHSVFEIRGGGAIGPLEGTAVGRIKSAYLAIELVHIILVGVFIGGPLAILDGLRVGELYGATDETRVWQFSVGSTTSDNRLLFPKFLAHGEVADLEGNEEQLMEAFRECQEGRCSCPTREYQKLGSLQVEQKNGEIKLRLVSKHGTKFEEAEIEQCMEHTKGRISPPK